MSSASDLTPQIEQGAIDPAAAMVDGNSVSAKPLPDLIHADQYLAAKCAAGKRHRGLRFSVIDGPAQLSFPRGIGYR